MRVAAIDLGSNTLRLLLTESDGKKLSTIQEIIRSPRAGEEVASTKNITAAAMIRILDVLRRYRIEWERMKAERIKAIATAFARGAENWDQLSESIKREIGIEVDVISANEEAELSFLGATCDLGEISGICMIDVGGGSTELIYKQPATKSFSIPIGALNLAEQYQGQKELRTAIDSVLQTSKITSLPQRVVASGGTACTLAAIAQNLRYYSAEKVDRYILTSSNISDLTNKLFNMPIDQRKILIPWDPTRAEILPAGAMILQQLMKYFGWNELMVRHQGLIYGLALKAGEA